MSMNDWDELGRTLLEWTASGVVEVREDGQWLAGLSATNYELRQSGKAVLIHLWSSERNLTRRVLRLRDRSADRVVLEVQRFGRSKPGSLEFLLVDSQRPKSRVTREEFRARFRRFLAERFPDSTIDSLTSSPDLQHSFSGIYLRGRMHEGSREYVFLAVSPSENSAAIEGVLAFGILWLDWTRSRAEKRPIEGLRVFVPEGTSRFLRERALALAPGARLEVFEFDESESRLRKMDPGDAGNLESRLTPRAETESVLCAARDAIARIESLAPSNSRLPGNVTARMTSVGNEVALCFRGLEFAHWSREGITFGLGEERRPLTEGARPRLLRLLRDLSRYRSPLASETTHPLFRAAPERWLEALVLEDSRRIDPRLDERYLYSEVPAVAGRERGVLDVLGVTLQGRLVIIELKVSEDIQMPVQAVDYWLRVRRHQTAGEFQRQGYFAGREISPEPPVVWLVAPALRFHPATDTLLRYLSPEISITRIGVAENWRRGLKVVLRQ